MWKLGPRPRYSFSGNICFENSVFCLCSVYFIQHCFIFRPSGSTLSKDAVLNLVLLRIWHWQSDALITRLIHTRLDFIHHRLDLIHIRLDLIHNSTRSHPHSIIYCIIHTRLGLSHTWLDLIHTRLGLIHDRLDLIHSLARSHPHSARTHPHSARSPSQLG